MEGTDALRAKRLSSLLSTAFRLLACNDSASDNFLFGVSNAGLNGGGGGGGGGMFMGGGGGGAQEGSGGGIGVAGMLP